MSLKHIKLLKEYPKYHLIIPANFKIWLTMEHYIKSSVYDDCKMGLLYNDFAASKLKVGQYYNKQPDDYIGVLIREEEFLFNGIYRKCDIDIVIYFETLKEYINAKLKK